MATKRASTVTITDHTPLRQTSFRGLYSRGLADSAPDTYQTSCVNCKFDTAGIETRTGLALNISKSNIRRFFVYKRLNETPRFIILDTSGNLFDSLAPGTPIYTDTSFVDFSMACSNNRAYITPHNRIKGIPNKYVLVYQGSGTARLAGGSGAGGFLLTVAESVNSGNIEKGIHLFAIAYMTDTGFVTGPGPEVWGKLDASGGKAVNIGSIPVGPPGTVARVILATKSVPSSLYDGNQYSQELFFVPDGIINNNVDTGKTEISFFDADLVESADYLIDSLGKIPAGVGIGFYNGRMIVWGEDANEFTIRVSNKLQPESFNSISGFINCDPADAASGIRNCFEHRRSLIICTSTKILTTLDNDSDPNTWTAPTIVSKDAGTECFGVATIQDARGTNTDRVLIADRSGLISFEGYVKRPELTWNIQDTWYSINKNKFNLVQVTDDPTNHRIVISCPTGTSSVCDTVIFGDYSEAITVYQTIDEKMIKWSTWTFPSAASTNSFSGDLDQVTNNPVLHFALSSGNIYTMKDNLTDDFGNAIDSAFTTALKTAVPGMVNHYSMIHLRLLGNGALKITLFSEDQSATANPPSITMAQTPGREYDRLINFVNEKMSAKFRVSSFGEWFMIDELIIFAKPLWLRRPA